MWESAFHKSFDDEWRIWDSNLTGDGVLLTYLQVEIEGHHVITINAWTLDSSLDNLNPEFDQ